MASTPTIKEEVPCVVCGTLTTAYCAACHTAAYCKRECQVADWKAQHKNTCASLPAPLRGLSLRFPNNKTPLTEQSSLCLLARSTSTNGGEGLGLESFYVHPERARTGLKEYLEGLGSSMVVDCALFVQLVAAAEGILGRASTGPLVFGIGGWAPWLVLERAAKAPSYLAPGYYSSTDPAVISLLQHAPSCKGQWLSGPDKKGRYLGMTEDGPMRLWLPQWHERFIAGLKKELALMDPSIAQQLSLLIGVGDLDLPTFKVFREPEKEEDLAKTEAKE